MIMCKDYKHAWNFGHKLLLSKTHIFDIIDQKCCRFISVIQIHQLHMLWIKLKVKIQCLCVTCFNPSTTTKIRFWQTYHISSWQPYLRFWVVPNLTFVWNCGWYESQQNANLWGMDQLVLLLLLPQFSQQNLDNPFFKTYFGR